MANDQILAAWAIGGAWFLMASLIVLHSMTPREPPK